MAIAAGRRLSDRLFGGAEGAKADYTNVPVSCTSGFYTFVFFLRNDCEFLISRRHSIGTRDPFRNG